RVALVGKAALAGRGRPDGRERAGVDDMPYARLPGGGQHAARLLRALAYRAAYVAQGVWRVACRVEQHVNAVQGGKQAIGVGEVAVMPVQRHVPNRADRPGPPPQPVNLPASGVRCPRDLPADKTRRTEHENSHHLLRSPVDQKTPRVMTTQGVDYAISAVVQLICRRSATSLPPHRRRART